MSNRTIKQLACLAKLLNWKLIYVLKRSLETQVTSYSFCTSLTVHSLVQFNQCDCMLTKQVVEAAGTSFRDTTLGPHNVTQGKAKMIVTVTSFHIISHFTFHIISIN